MNLAKTVKNEVKTLMGVSNDTTTEVEEEETLLEGEQELEEEDVTDSEGDETGETEEEETGEEGETEGAADGEETSDTEGEVSEGNMDELKKENEELRALLEDVLGPKKEEGKPGEETVEAVVTPKLEIKAQAYVKADDIDAIITGDTAGVEALNKVLNDVRRDTVNMVIEHVARSIPELVSVEATRVVAAHTAVNEFYMANQDLRPYKKFTGHIYDELSVQHPDKQLIDFLDGSKGAVDGRYDLATEVRKKLKMRSATIQKKKPESKSKLPGGTSGSERRGIKNKPPEPRGVKAEVEQLKGKFGVR